MSITLLRQVMPNMNPELGKRIVALKRLIVPNFNSGHWHELALLTGHSHVILQHPRLLRSLGFGDDDYEGNVVAVLQQIAEFDPQAVDDIETYILDQFPSASNEISSKPADRRVTVSPSVFVIPNEPRDRDLVSIMMPMRAEFAGVHSGIQRACTTAGLRSLRVDNVWESSVIAQDIFSLIFRSQIVIVDFTGRNPNVMYETGIAHTLGRDVVPIAQSIDDVPFDLKHHRVLTYLNNEEGLNRLSTQLAERLRRLRVPAPSVTASPADDDEEVPF